MGCSNSAELATKQELVSNYSLNVFGAEYAAPESKAGECPFVLHFNHKLSWSNADYNVQNPQNKQLWFKVDGQALSLRCKKTMFDANGKPVFLIKEKLAQLDDKQTVCTPDESQELFVISSNFGNTEQRTTVKDVNGVEHEIYMAMDFLGCKGGMWIGNPEKGGKLIAKIRSPVELQNFIPNGWDAQDFYVEFAAGVDTAFMVAMIVGYTEMEDTYDD